MQAGDLERHQAALEVDHRTIVHEHCEARVVTRSARQPCACGLWFCGQPKHFCSQARPPGRAQRGAVVKIHAATVCFSPHALETRDREASDGGSSQAQEKGSAIPEISEALPHPPACRATYGMPRIAVVKLLIALGGPTA